jgi:hypothetical protein
VAVDGGGVIPQKLFSFLQLQFFRLEKRSLPIHSTKIKE